MESIRKKILTDEGRRPVAVQLDYGDWLRIEPLLRERGLLSTDAIDPNTDFDALLAQTRGIWTSGDGLDYQRRLRDEWARPWDPDAAEDT